MASASTARAHEAGKLSRLAFRLFPSASDQGPLRRWWAAYRPALASRDLLFAALTALFTLGSWTLSLTGGPPRVVLVLGLAGALAGGATIAWGAARGLAQRRMNVDELVTVAIVASIALGEYWGAALVAFMMLSGKVLEDVTAARAERAIEGLGALVPALAHLRAGHAERDVPVGEIKAGDVVAVRPGERLPVDGVVLAGQAAVEEAAITGEPLPVEKGEGDEVFAGTLNAAGALEVRTTRTGAATALGRIAVLVQQAEADRAPIVRLADRWATWFTPSVLLLAGLVLLLRREVLPAVTVLVVACPCVLVLATPMAMVAGIARGARRGILVKGGSRLEAAGEVDVVCLDKTGTLTSGRPAVQSLRLLPAAVGIEEGAVLAYAAAAERLSEHPLARAIVAAAEQHAAEQHASAPLADAAEFAAFPGRGVAARVTGKAVLVGNPSWLVERGVPLTPEAAAAIAEVEAAGWAPLAVALDGSPLAIFGVADAVRPEAAAAVQALRQAGRCRIVLLTGDAAAPALAAAQAAGIPPLDVHSRLLPEDKVAWVKRLQAEGHRVAMVGDGVNDAPALAAADLAIAMGAAGTDLAMAAADVVLMTDDLRQAAAALTLGRKTLATIRQNLVFAAVWNVAAVALAVLGGLAPVSGALVHNLGSVAVVLNAARLVGRARADKPLIIRTVDGDQGAGVGRGQRGQVTRAPH